MNKLAWIALLALALVVPTPALAACGDGVRDGTDVCDDGNAVAGDGCSATCTVESGFRCDPQPHLAITNPSFETDPFPSGTTGGGWTRLTVADVDWVGDSSLYLGTSCWPAGDGHFSIDMNGMGTQGTMYQTLATSPGQTYTLTFLGNANSNDGSGIQCDTALTLELTVTVADGTGFTARTQPAHYSLTHPLNVRDNWVPCSYTFTASSSQTTLVFQGSSTSSNGPMIDRLAIPADICVPITCGNGVVGAGETCDDGNRTSGDGCSGICQTEPGYTCATAGAACAATLCGDGLLARPEACDDKNTTSGDGCSATCTVEPLYVCVYDGNLARSVCTMSCGNGTLDPGEVCDDHNHDDHDMCSNTCLLGPTEPCLFDAQCNLGRCHPSGFHCQGCYDTAGPGMMDYPCTSGGPICDTSGAFPLCVGCVVNADCPAGGVCNAGHACDPGSGDAGVDAAVTMSDAGRDAGSDGGTTPDAGRDAAAPADAGFDASPSPDAAPTGGGISGGACNCATYAHASGATWRAMLGLGLLALVVRRLRTRSGRRA